MKKFAVYLILICIINLFNPYTFCGAEEDVNLKIEKHKNIAALVDKKTNREILPYKYNKIRKVKYDKKTLYIAEAANFITLYSPDGMYDDFLEKYYLSNKYNSNVKFINYPSKGIIRYSQNNKYGLILAEKDKLHITKPIYEKIVFPDEKSIVSKFLDISFAPEDMVIAYSTYLKGKYRFQTFQQILNNDSNEYNFKLLNIPAYIKENITIGNNEINIEYNGSEYFQGGIVLSDITPVKYNTDIYTPYEFYNIINSEGKYYFGNYPSNIVVKDGYHIYAYENTLKYEITLPCSDYFIEDSVFKTLTGAEISFGDGENIIAKNGLWGIINKNNEVKVPFIYDEIYPLSRYYSEKIYSDKDCGNHVYNIQYSSKERKNELFLTKKGYAWGIINEQNQAVIPFETQKQYSENELAKVKQEINNKIKADYLDNERENTIRSIPFFILDILLLPVWLLMPSCIGIHAHIHYR